MKVRLHSNEKPAAEATDRTLRSLPPMFGECYLKRDDAGEIAFDEQGLATVEASDPGAVAFALRNQGYVLEVVDEHH